MPLREKVSQEEKKKNQVQELISFPELNGHTSAHQPVEIDSLRWSGGSHNDDNRLDRHHLI